MSPGFAVVFFVCSFVSFIYLWNSKRIPCTFSKKTCFFVILWLKFCLTTLVLKSSDFNNYVKHVSYVTSLKPMTLTIINKVSLAKSPSVLTPFSWDLGLFYISATFSRWSTTPVILVLNTISGYIPCLISLQKNSMFLASNSE